MVSRLKTFLPFFLTVFLLCCHSTGQNQSATLLRDDFGVPHIYADTEAAGAYVHGYAQAEDRLEQILKNYKWAEGTLAEVLGKKYLELDWRTRAWQHARISAEKYGTLPRETRSIMEAFIAGLKAYMKAHPEKVPEWAPEIEPWHIVALGRAFIWGWPEGDCEDDLRRRDRKPAPPPTKGSNQWVLAGSRTKAGVPILLTDPHLSWATSGKWTEVRLHAGEVQASGMVIPGMPFLALGHNNAIAWAATTGGPDCGDVYAIETDPEHPTRYLYDGAWREMTVDTVRLRYSDNGRMKTETRIIERSHLGPIMRRDGKIAYAFAIPYADQVLLAETMRRIMLAKSVDEFKAALAMQQFLPQNMMAADIHGDIYYQRTGRVPIRPAGYNYHYPVSGNTSATAWQGIHPTADLVQILNPNTGYMQNCNISPGTMMQTGAPARKVYPPYIYNDREDRSNPRGRRAVALLQQASGVDVPAAMKIAFDVQCDARDITPWLRALKAAQANPANRARVSGLREAIAALVDWNLRFDADNTTAFLYLTWRQKIRKARHVRLQDVRRPGQLSIAHQRALLDALLEATAELQQRFGSLHVAWGEVYRLRRDEMEFPISGTGFGSLGLSTLRNIWGEKSDDGRKYIAVGGQSCPTLVVLSQPIQSYSILPFGISDDPASPHYTDQMQRFSQGRMKPTYFNRNELDGHILSTRTFPVPDF